MSKERNLAKNTAIITIGKICTQLISFLLLPLYTAFLTTTEYGVVDLLNTLVSLLIPIISFQIDMGIFRFLIDKREDKEGIKQLITSVFYFLLTQIFIFLSIFMVISRWINNEYKYFLAFNLIATVFTNLLLQIARGLGDNKKYTIGSFLSGVATLCLNVILIAKFRLGAYGMLYAHLIGNIVCIIYIFVSLKIYKYINRKDYNKKVFKEVLKYSLPLIPNSISWWIVNVSDRVIITYFINIATNGIYSVANKFSSLITIMYNVFNIAWTESAAVNFESEDRDKFFSNILDKTIRFFGALGLGIIGFMPLVFNILVNVNYSEAYLQIPILIVATIFNILVSFLGSIYVAKKITKEISKTSFMAAVINVIINVALIQKIGLYAASISTLVAWISMFIYRLIDSKKYVNLYVKKELIFSMIFMFVIALIIYYLKNMYLCIFAALIVTIYAIYINKQNIGFALKSIKGKLKRA